MATEGHGRRKSGLVPPEARSRLSWPSVAKESPKKRIYKMETKTIPIDKALKMPFREVLDGLTPYIMQQIPEGAIDDPGALREIDRLIGRFSNLHSYLTMLYCYASDEVSRLQAAGRTEEKLFMGRRKDGFHRLIRAVENKHEACSRMVTISSKEDLYERPNYQKRSGRGGWDEVDDSDY